MAKKKRILIKLSGSAMGDSGADTNLNFVEIKKLAQNLKKLLKVGYQIAIVSGAGNIFRARMVKGGEIDKTIADHIGMMATHINALALQGVLENIGQKTVVLSPFYIPKIVQPYNHEKAIEYLQKNTIVILAGGTGNPYFTTDTTMVLRALEIKADEIFKATNVNGVYDSDPDKNPKAKFYKKISYTESLDKNLKIMDATAFALAKENNLKIRVFRYSADNILKVVNNNNLGTTIYNEPR